MEVVAPVIPTPYTYDLPKERIAQRPVHPPESARLMVVERSSGKIEDSTFASLGEFLPTGSRLVFNDTMVIPARLFGTLSPTGAQIELLLVRRISSSDCGKEVVWSCLGRPLKRIRKAEKVIFSDELTAVVEESAVLESANIRFISHSERFVDEVLHAHGSMPIPPYIREGRGDEEDRSDYQTIFAERPGSVAAPTASLHFSKPLIESLKVRGVTTSFLTLHVGTASFQPVIVNGEVKPPGAESLMIPETTQKEVRDTRAGGGKVIGVGTTVTRALETMSLGNTSGETDLFIIPGYKYQIIDGLITNFHQPGTTHLLLVEAFLGRELLDKVYRHGLERGYRFLSYGDGMILL
jgi:S-adenosylmethionine:tRNA ribosyltransferase-isomerase